MAKRIGGMRAVVVAGVVAVTVPGLADSAWGQNESPVAAARFGISIDGVQVGLFAQLTSEADLESGAAGHAITLTGGRTQGMEIAAWHELVILGDVGAARKTATIVMYDRSGSPVKRYHLENAWPIKVALDSSGRDLRTSTVMLMYDVLRVQEE